MSDAGMTRPSPDGDRPLGRAAAVLRARADDRWTQVEGDVLGELLRARRTSLPVLVRTGPDGGTTSLGEQVVVTLLRSSLDAALPDAATGRIHLAIDVHHQLRRVTVELLARYGVDLVELGDRARAVVDAQVAQWLQDPAAVVVVDPVHVHVGDVVDGDPHLLDAADEVDRG